MADKAWQNQLSQIVDRLGLLEDKYAGLGQDLLSYLDGLYYSNGLTYWDYIHLDSLLGLQMPRTPFKDEMIFIIYHQVTELMFKLTKLEVEYLAEEQGEASEYLVPENWTKRLGRCVKYIRHLSQSFDIMLTGMDTEELRKFRMALLPASGFQSVQFRHIEIMSTGLPQLAKLPTDDGLPMGLEEMYPYIYWKQGGIDLETQTKTLTLKAFEEKYDESLIQLLRKFDTRNLYQRFTYSEPAIKENEAIKAVMREFDLQVNVFWKLSHLAAAAYHLKTDQETIEATGGTNWRTFLPPRFQQIIFFPSLWSETERAEWGKAAVVKAFKETVSNSWNS